MFRAFLIVSFSKKKKAFSPMIFILFTELSPLFSSLPFSLSPVPSHFILLSLSLSPPLSIHIYINTHKKIINKKIKIKRVNKEMLIDPTLLSLKNTEATSGKQRDKLLQTQYNMEIVRYQLWYLLSTLGILYTYIRPQ